MTDEEFTSLCTEYPDLFFEMTADGSIVVTPPNYSLTAARNQAIGAQLQNWATLDGRGIATDASGGFVLPSGARRSPDAAWTSRARLRELSRESLERYWHLCPDFVIELRSTSDRISTLREKMEEWVANGAQLAWLIGPETRTVEVYRPDRAPETISADSIAGEGPVEGFVLYLPLVWDPLAS